MDGCLVIRLDKASERIWLVSPCHSTPALTVIMVMEQIHMIRHVVENAWNVKILKRYLHKNNFVLPWFLASSKGENYLYLFVNSVLLGPATALIRDPCSYFGSGVSYIYASFCLSGSGNESQKRREGGVYLEPSVAMVTAADIEPHGTRLQGRAWRGQREGFALAREW